jgi:signal-transduction protein with cAMP-binding, CBS, and nucleotidyltransferase domain
MAVHDLQQRRVGGMKVQEFMTSKIEVVDSNSSVYEAAEKMVDKRIRSVAVRFSSSEDDFGVLTTRDIVFKVLAKGINPKKVKVSEIASKPVVCIDRESDMDDAATQMLKSNIARLFVCDQGKIVGLVSLLDVMAAELISHARGDHVS